MRRPALPRGRLAQHSVHSFAFVAGTAVIGADFLLAGHTQLAPALRCLAAALWLAVAFMIRQAAGGSLLMIVAAVALAA